MEGYYICRHGRQGVYSVCEQSNPRPLAKRETPIHYYAGKSKKVAAFLNPVCMESDGDIEVLPVVSAGGVGVGILYCIVLLYGGIDRSDFWNLNRNFLARIFSLVSIRTGRTDT